MPCLEISVFLIDFNSVILIKVLTSYLFFYHASFHQLMILFILIASLFGKEWTF